MIRNPKEESWSVASLCESQGYPSLKSEPPVLVCTMNSASWVRVTVRPQIPKSNDTPNLEIALNPQP